MAAKLKPRGNPRLNPGGFSRTQHMGGGKVWGISSKMASPSHQGDHCGGS
ncbi:phage tail tube protein [Escherichia coli]